MNQNRNTSKKVAVFYAFLTCQGGGERLMFTIRDYFNADFYTGAVDSSKYSLDASNSFSKHLYNGVGAVTTLHEDSKIPVWYVLKRLWFYAFSPVIDEIARSYDEVIVSGNVSFVAWRLKRAAKKYHKTINTIAFVHTPPRKFTDQKTQVLAKFPSFLRPIIDTCLKTCLYYGYTKEFSYIDTVFTNSANIQNRLKTYCGIESDWIFPPADLERFRYISTSDYYISYSRLEDAKRIKLVVEAFSNMPEKKLILCSTGPLKDWVQSQAKLYPNIEYKGLVSDEELADLVGNSIAGITIPVNEDAGITQLEIMAASKPVIGVAEGGLLDTVIDQKTGVLIPPNPTVVDLQHAVQEMDVQKALAMKDECRKQAEKFSIASFFDKWNSFL